MNTQTEAQRLADVLRDPCKMVDDFVVHKTATELLRLDAENAKLTEQRDALLDALKELLASDRTNSLEIVGRDTDGHPLNAAGVARKKARAAIAKVKGETS